MQENISRRGFVAGAAAATAGAAVAGAVVSAAVAEESGAAGSGAEGSAAQSAGESRVVPMACDIVIVGAGSSGLAAAVQAAELGASVICIEREGAIGGNGQLTDGMFGIGSHMMKDAGMEADGGALIRAELEYSQFRGSGAALSAMVHASGENIDWLMEQGVTFAVVDPETFHSFSGGFEGAGGAHYAEPMEAKARELGVEFLTKTLATGLTREDDGTWTVTAEGIDDTIAVNAQVCMLAGGGFVQNKELMQRYFEVDIDSEVEFLGLPGHDGSCIDMALAAGAKTNMGRAGLQGCVQVVGMPTYLEGGHFSGKLENAPFPGIWVNQDAVRFVNEDCGESNWALSDMATMLNKETYVLFDQAMYNTFVDNLEDQPGHEVVDAELEEGIAIGQIVCADTWEEIAEKTGLDAAQLTATVEGFNAVCEAGVDTDFGKKPEYLQAFGEPPYLAIRTGHLIICSFAGVTTDLKSRALDESNQPIPGLYVIGLDGAMLWANEYTLALPGGTNANNVHSGRMAAKDAVEYIG